MKSTQVKDVFSESFTSVYLDDNLSTCFSLFEEKKPPVIVVFNSKEQYEGVIARRWLVRSRFDPSTTKVSALSRKVPTVTIFDSINTVAKLMVENEVRQLPVYSGEKLKGVITAEDIIHNYVLSKWGNKQVKSIMTTKPFTIEETDSVGAVISLFREKNIFHVPVIVGQKLVGIISIHDIIVNIFHPRQRQTRGEIIGEN